MTFDGSVPNAARIYDFLLGGKDHFATDREAARKMLAVLPGTADACHDNRAFLQRAVRYLAGQAGIRQFVDIGTGLPTMGNVHEVAQAVAPGARVAYVDYDPVVLSHARALLATSDTVTVAEGDLRSPGAILDEPGLRKLIDFAQPVALLLIAVLHFIADDEQPHRAVRTLVDTLAPGSYLAISHATPDDIPADVAATMTGVYAGASAQVTARSYPDIARFFHGLEPVDPGLVSIAAWRPDRLPTRPAHAAGRSLIYGGVAVKRPAP